MSAVSSSLSSGLSAPTSSVLMVTGLPFMATTALRYDSNCSSSDGSLFTNPVRPMNKNSERNKPTPTAPASKAETQSSGNSMFANI